MNIGFEEVKYENFSVGQHIYKYVLLKSLVSNGLLGDRCRSLER